MAKKLCPTCKKHYSAKASNRRPMKAISVLREDIKKGRQERKIGRVMGEFKEKKLRSGSKRGPKVKSIKQAMAIALSEAGVKRRNKKKK